MTTSMLLLLFIKSYIMWQGYLTPRLFLSITIQVCPAEKYSYEGRPFLSIDKASYIKKEIQTKVCYFHFSFVFALVCLSCLSAWI